ncbi:hypothetical protein CU044_5533 [Streptomyces sp. L-9-10]|nr:hypothetical protein CU044_5533 [Streptomyces sp. L-9-10]
MSAGQHLREQGAPDVGHGQKYQPRASQAELTGRRLRPVAEPLAGVPHPFLRGLGHTLTALSREHQGHTGLGDPREPRHVARGGPSGRRCGASLGRCDCLGIRAVLVGHALATGTGGHGHLSKGRPLRTCRRACCSR